MVQKAEKIKIIPTNNLLEAILLEANLIKEIQPKYNIREKDGKTFSYLVITTDKFPKLILARRKDLEKITVRKNNIFGPYPNRQILLKILKILRPIFQFSSCNENQDKPCFYRQIGLCPGVCTGEITEKKYKNNIKNIKLFLRGENKKLQKILQIENPEIAEKLKSIQDVSLYVRDEIRLPQKYYRIEGYDISHFSSLKNTGAMVVFENGERSPQNYRTFNIKFDKNNDIENLKEVIFRRLNHSECQMPDLILIDGGRPQINFIDKFFKEKNITIPIVGISKYNDFQFVFPKNISDAQQKLTLENKNTLLKVQAEAHRFANYRRKQRDKKLS